MPHARAGKYLGRKRIIAARTLIVLGLLSVVPWLASRWWRVHYFRGSFSVGVHYGRLVINQYDPDPWALPTVERSFYVQRTPKPALAFWLGWRDPDSRAPTDESLRGVVRKQWLSGKFWELEFLLWPVPVVLVAAGATLVYWVRAVQRRTKDRLCLCCGYSLAGIERTATACPECGTGRELTSA